ncbi:MAG: hypothetical protein KGJ02_00710 [Verrucomicrobiota bacterium]|nr:hypothetical protein [Verrucomicrobiota bacterium]
MSSISSSYNVLPASADRYTILEMSPEDVKRIEARMWPFRGKHPKTNEEWDQMEWNDPSDVGFLSKEESLKDVCDCDLMTLQQLGVTCDEICDVWEKFHKSREEQATSRYHHTPLELFMEKRKKGEEVPVVWNHPKDEKPFEHKPLRVSYFCSADGVQECPFGEREKICFSSNEECMVENKAGDWVVVSKLTIHMIRKHGFFQGDTAYRLDPTQFAKVFKLGKHFNI